MAPNIIAISQPAEATIIPWNQVRSFLTRQVFSMISQKVTQAVMPTRKSRIVFHSVDAMATARGTIIILSLIHISEPTRLGMISYAVFCLKKKKKQARREGRDMS